MIKGLEKEVFGQRFPKYNLCRPIQVPPGRDQQYIPGGTLHTNYNGILPGLWLAVLSSLSQAGVI